MPKNVSNVKNIKNSIKFSSLPFSSALNDISFAINNFIITFTLQTTEKQVKT